MESALVLWIKDCRKKNSLDTNTIQTKAKKLYDSFAESTEVPDGDEDEDEEVETECFSHQSNLIQFQQGLFNKF